MVIGKLLVITSYGSEPAIASSITLNE